MASPDRSIFQESLRALVSVPEPVEDRLFAHHELMHRWGRVHNLSTVLASAEAARVHYADCVLAAAGWTDPPRRVWDIGSGAGFPGLAFASLWPDIEVHLVDAARKRCSFLQEAVRGLRLHNVQVHHARFEQLALFDGGVTSRATVSAERLEYGPLMDRLAPGAELFLLAGEQPDLLAWTELCTAHEVDAPARESYAPGRAVLRGHKR